MLVAHCLYWHLVLEDFSETRKLIWNLMFHEVGPERFSQMSMEVNLKCTCSYWVVCSCDVCGLQVLCVVVGQIWIATPLMLMHAMFWRFQNTSSEMGWLNHPPKAKTPVAKVKEIVNFWHPMSMYLECVQNCTFWLHWQYQGQRWKSFSQGGDSEKIF